MSLSAILAAIGAAIPLIIGLATIVVALTPTQKDDRWLGRIMKLVEAASLAQRRPAVVRADITTDELEAALLAIEDADARSPYRLPPPDTRTPDPASQPARDTRDGAGASPLTERL